MAPSSIIKLLGMEGILHAYKRPGIIFKLYYIVLYYIYCITLHYIIRGKIPLENEFMNDF